MVLLVHGGPWARDALGLQSRTTSGWPTAATPCCRSTSAARPASARSSSTPATASGAARCTTTCSTPSNWAVKEGIADPDRVAIMGGTYGGYATLVGLTFTPDVFGCGVDIVGPSNLVTLLETIPPYWAAVLREPRPPRRRSAHRGGAQAAAGALAAARCRRHHQAAADRPGRQRPARQAGRGRPDRRRHAGQEHARSPTCSTPTRATASRVPENRISFYAITEAFLAAHLGGRASRSARTSPVPSSRWARAPPTCPAWRRLWPAAPAKSA